MDTDFERVKRFLLVQNWREAKTYAKTFPHDYVVYQVNDERKDFEFVVDYIRKNGIQRRFWRKMFIYLQLDGYEYWTYGDPISETIILNKAIIKKI